MQFCWDKATNTLRKLIKFLWWIKNKHFVWILCRVRSMILNRLLGWMRLKYWKGGRKSLTDCEKNWNVHQPFFYSIVYWLYRLGPVQPNFCWKKNQKYNKQNNVKNCDNRVLELVFSTNVRLVDLNGSDIFLVRPDSYHPPIEFNSEYERVS